MVAAVWHQKRGAAVHGSVLDSGVRRIRAVWLGGLAGECAGHQEFAWQEERRTGKSMAVKAAHLRIIEKIVPAGAGDSRSSHVLAGARGGRAASPQAELAE